MTYAALHVHTELSVLDGRAHVEDLVKAAREYGLAALSITDHGSLSGLYSMHSECKKYSVKPILGIEAYESPLSRTHKAPVFWGTPDQRRMDVSGAGKFTHLTLFAQDSEGLRSLYRLFSESYTSGFYGKPRVDSELLGEHSRGLIATSGCLGGAVQTHIRLGQLREARDKLAEYREIFGPENFYVEVMRHDAVPEEPEVEAVLVRLAHELQLPVVATLDSHYVHEEEAGRHDDMLCLSMNQRKSSETRMRFSGNGYHLQTPEEFHSRFSDLPEAVENTLRLADQIGSYDSAFQYEMRLPDVRLEAFGGRSLRAVVGADGLPEQVDPIPNDGVEDSRDGDRADTQRLDYELSVIESRGFDNYLLVVADIVAESRERGVRFGPARGSAAGSVVVFRLGITEIDPREYGLIFERFINPERPGFPDVDMDCSDRDLVIQVARELYGDDYVAQIGTKMTVGAKKALRAAANLAGEPFAEGSRLIELLPRALFGRQPTLKEMSGNGGRPDLVEVASGLEGYIYGEGIHPAGVLISGVPLKDILPVKRPVRKDESITVTSFDMNEVEKLGLLKTDYLGLDTMGVIDECVRLLQRLENPSRPERLVCQLPREFTDPGVYELLTAGETTGVFQLESPGMRRLLKQVHPESLLDISAVLALFRPGPMGVNAHEGYANRKNGRNSVEYPHPEFAGALSGILGPTYGLVVFQEQVLDILRVCGGYTYGTAALIFDAMRKKDRDKLKGARPDFFARLHDQGYSDEASQALWEVLVPFADYSFNKTHSTGYGIISYWTAYLKRHHTREFFTALLTYGDEKRLHEYINEAIRWGVKILGPDINTSNLGWTLTDEGVRFGLGSVKGISVPTSKSLEKVRPFTSVQDYLQRAPKALLNLGTFRSLVQVGAFDSVHPDREGLLKDVDILVSQAVEFRKDSSRMWSTFIVRRGVKSVQKRRADEKELLGLALSYGRVKIRFKRFLSESEMVWLSGVLRGHPGSSEVDFTISPLTDLKGVTAISQEALPILRSMSILEVEEEK